MKEWFDFIAAYPTWVKIVVPGLLFAVVMILIFVRPSKPSGSTSSTPPTQPQERYESPLESLILELRVTATLSESAEIPPGEYHFEPITGAPAQFVGPPGALSLLFQSPIRFRRLETGEIVVINRFALPSGSDFVGRPLSVLAQFKSLQVPVVTAVYGRNFEQLGLVEVSLAANGEDLWYEAWPMPSDFPKGQAINVPLDKLRDRLGLRPAG